MIDFSAVVWTRPHTYKVMDEKGLGTYTSFTFSLKLNSCLIILFYFVNIS